MKITFYIILFFVIGFSCSSETQKNSISIDSNSITFIGQFENSSTEVVIKKMIRNSVNDKEYMILRQNDTIKIECIGRTFFKVGERNRILDSLIVEKEDVIIANVFNDSLTITSKKSDVKANLDWLCNYHSEIEQSYEKIFSSISSRPDNLEDFSKSIHFSNEYEIIEHSLAHVFKYQVDVNAYNEKKHEFNEKLKANYKEHNAAISVAQIDLGSKLILKNSLFNITVDAFRRTGTVLQEWMFDILNKQVQEDCQSNLTLSMSNFYLNYSTGKKLQNISFPDLEKAYHKADNITCPRFRLEVKKLCLLKMFENNNKLDIAKSTLATYVEHTGDTAFYHFVERKYSIEESASSDQLGKSLFIDINDKGHQFNELIEKNKGKVILVDYWASWCAPCRDGMPDVKQLEDKYKKQNFQVIYASIDQKINPWKRAARDEGIYERDNYWVSNWVNSAVYKNYKITHIPRYMIYDKSGNVAYQNAPKPDAMFDIIDDLLSK